MEDNSINKAFFISRLELVRQRTIEKYRGYVCAGSIHVVQYMCVRDRYRNRISTNSTVRYSRPAVFLAPGPPPALRFPRRRAVASRRGCGGPGRVERGGVPEGLVEGGLPLEAGVVHEHDRLGVVGGRLAAFVELLRAAPLVEVGERDHGAVVRPHQVAPLDVVGAAGEPHRVLPHVPHLVRRLSLSKAPHVHLMHVSGDVEEMSTKRKRCGGERKTMDGCVRECEECRRRRGGNVYIYISSDHLAASGRVPMRERGQDSAGVRAANRIRTPRQVSCMPNAHIVQYRTGVYFVLRNFIHILRILPECALSRHCTVSDVRQEGG